MAAAGGDQPLAGGGKGESTSGVAGGVKSTGSVPGGEASATDEPKRVMRAALRAERETLTSVARSAQSRAIAERVMALPQWGRARTIAVYLSRASEVQTDRLIDRALADGRLVCAPCQMTRAGVMSMCELRSRSDLCTGAWGLQEPQGALIDPAVLDLVLVPGVGFSASGARLGMGGGYYDRFFATTRTPALRVGLAYDLQIVDELPQLDTDQPVDWVITATRSIDCRVVQSKG